MQNRLANFLNPPKTSILWDKLRPLGNVFKFSFCFHLLVLPLASLWHTPFLDAYSSLGSTLSLTESVTKMENQELYNLSLSFPLYQSLCLSLSNSFLLSLLSLFSFLSLLSPLPFSLFFFSVLVSQFQSLCLSPSVSQS